MGLDWHRFVLAVDENGDMIACGQVKPHRDGSQELASIAVEPGWRGKGAARAIIEYLLEQHPGTLYLTCRSRLGSFYEKFGFRVIPEAELPSYFKLASRFIRLLNALKVTRERILVMKRE